MSSEDIDSTQAPLVEHLIELRQRLIRAIFGFAIFFVVGFYFADEIFNFLLLPYEWAIGDSTQLKLIFISPQEFFFTQLKIGMFVGLFMGFPLIATQIYKFVAPGLYKNEKEAFRPYLIATPILFAAGGALVFFFILPVAMKFFASFEWTGESDLRASITLLPSVAQYLSLVMTLILAFGICFQLPVILTLLGRVGLISSVQLRSGRKYAVVGVVAIAAVFTPPDPFSQLGLAIPMCLLYEAAIYAVQAVEKKRAADEAAREAELNA